MDGCIYIYMQVERAALSAARTASLLAQIQAAHLEGDISGGNSLATSLVGALNQEPSQVAGVDGSNQLPLRPPFFSGLPSVLLCIDCEASF